jgi:hypothetical protein
MGSPAAANPVENSAMAGLLIVFVFGVIGEILQWLMLRRKVARAGWWPLASLLGSLAGAMGLPIAVAISETGNWALSLMTFGLVFGAGNGTITGAMLVWLLRQSSSGDVERLATAH